MNTANKLTILRIILIPIYLVFFLVDFPSHYYFAVIIYMIACITDFIDGKLARSRDQVTAFGMFADPLADKILVTSSLLCLMQAGRIRMIPILIVIIREFAVTGLRAAVAVDGIVLAAGKSGKLKTLLQMVCIIYLHFEIAMGNFSTLVGDILVWVMVAITIVSGVIYFYVNRESISFK